MSIKLDNKIASALEIISSALSIAKRPVVYFSGGKDSLVMTHLLKTRVKMATPLEAVFHREPFHSEKYARGEDVLRAWGIPFHDYPPLGFSFWEGNDWFAYTNHYQVGVDPSGKPTTMDLPKNVLPPDPDKPWICAVDSVINRPTSYFNYPWDMAFVGHKSSDEDQIAGKVPLKVDILQNRQGPSAAFPLRHWTDDDVWTYIQEHNLPIDRVRYDVISRSEWPDKTPNGDYFHACVACVDRRHGPAVYCPKLKRQISNMSAQVPYRDLKLDYFGA